VRLRLDRMKPAIKPDIYQHITNEIVAELEKDPTLSCSLRCCRTSPQACACGGVLASRRDAPLHIASRRISGFSDFAWSITEEEIKANDEHMHSMKLALVAVLIFIEQLYLSFRLLGFSAGQFCTSME
jgi:hypothetical protein